MMFINNLRKVLKMNIREYGMFIALFVIVGIFSMTTRGTFLSPRNISNLLNQTGYIAILAVGMTLVIVIRHIDLSVGFLAGFIGAIAAIAMVSWNCPVGFVIPFTIVLGIIAGFGTAYLVAQLSIPSFVASLAGWLIYRGLILLVTMDTGTIIIPNAAFNAIGNGYIPDFQWHIPFALSLHQVTLVIGLITIFLFILTAIKERRSKQAYQFEVLTMDMFTLKLVFMSMLIGYITWVLANFNGISWTVLIVLAVTIVYHFITIRTVLGRHIYAMGGNPDAAKLSGINVKKLTFIVFGSMGMLSALSGLLYASRLSSATTTAGTLFELDAIAAAYVGGVSAKGGVGRVAGSLIGALVMMSLSNGMNLMGIGIAPQYVVRGGVLAAAVIFDVATRKQSV